MKFPVTGKAQDIVLGSTATLALFLAYVSLPLAGMVAALFAPLPGVFFTLKSGKRVGMAIVAITAGVLAAVADPATVALYALQSGAISLALPFFLERQNGGARAIVSTVALAAILVAAAATIYGLSQGVDVHGFVQKGIDASISQTAVLYEKSGLKGEELQTFQQGLRQAGVLIGKVYPALIIICLGCITAVTLTFLRRLSPRLPVPPAVGMFREFKNPDQLIWAVIAAGFAMLVKYPGVTSAALNVLIVTLTLYFAQGLAVVIFYFNRLATPAFLRVLFYLFLVFQPYLAIAVTALGIFDLWGNFRSPKKPENL
ncbi:MAG TPA: YybS family protein [Geobacteraceae bacterium]